MDGLNITALSTPISNANLATDVSVALIKMAKDDMEVNAEGLRKMMEQSVNPNVGQNIDYYA